MTNPALRPEPLASFGDLEEGAAFARLAGKNPPNKGDTTSAESFDVVVIGAGQSGLAVAYQLRQKGLSFVVLDANERVGHVWRSRWDSLCLFTAARYDGLPGMPFPAPRNSFPTKDEMADYLELYAKHFNFPVRLGVRVERVSKRGDEFLVEAGAHRFVAGQVVVAMATYQKPKCPDFANELSPDIVQLHSIDYRNPSQLQPGPVLLVGAGNTGSELATELVKEREVYMSGRSVGAIPFRIERFWGRLLLVPFVLRILFHRVLTIRTPMGRRARSKIIGKGFPLIRVKPRDLRAAGVKRVPKTIAIVDGRPKLEDGTVLDVNNVIWCTGFHPGLSWLDVPAFDEQGAAKHTAGVCDSVPGLYFVGLEFLFAASSNMIQGVGRDAERVCGVLARRASALAKNAALAAA